MLQWILRAVVSVAVVVVLVTVASTEGLREAFGQVRASVWLASLAVFLGGHAVNAWKYQRLLHDPHATLALCLRAHFAGLVANLGLPGVAGGDVVRATYLLPHGVRPKAATVASIIDRLIDTLTLLGLIGIGVLVAGMPPALDRAAIAVRWPVVAGGALAAVAVAAVVLIRRRRGGGPGMAGDLLAEVRVRAGAIVTAFAVTTAVQSAFILSNVWMAGALGLDLGIAPWFIAWPLSKIVSILPISLGGIGVREAALVSLLAPYGAPSAIVFASGLLWQGVLITSGLLGLAVGAVLGPARPSVPPAPVPRP